LRARKGQVRDDCRAMSTSESRNGREVDSIPEGGILAALPRARPQRASARRAAARSGAATKTKPTPITTAKKPARTAAATKPTAGKKSAATEKPTGVKRPAKPKKQAETKRRVPKPTEPPAPKQGYEPEEEVELGATVHPPSGAELIESVADIVGELAGSSLAAGGHLLKDAFSLLRRR
jgi:hypothetical protein